MKSVALAWCFASEQRVRRIIFLVDVVLVLSGLLAYVGWLVMKGNWTLGTLTCNFAWHDRYLVGPVALLLLHVFLAGGADQATRSTRLGLFAYRPMQRFALVFVALAVSTVLAEQLLRDTHVDIRVAPLVLATRSNGVERYHELMLRDPELLWKFEPGSRVFGRRINRLGFREREVDPHKAPGVRRVICLGDSVTAQGQPGYAQYLHELLTNAPPGGGTWEAFGMGVYGYSSLQGLRLFETRVRALQPDVVTVSFGRNDHNLSQTTDQVRMAVKLSPFMACLNGLLSRRTVGRLLLHALDRRHQWSAVQNHTGVRVPPEDFRSNMRLLVDEIRGIGATPILITAPRRRIPESYVTNGYARTSAEFGKQHDVYAEIVREVAAEKRAPLLDLQQIMAAPECDGYFAADAVHFDAYEREVDIPFGSVEQPGLRRFARELYGAIRATCDTSTGVTPQ